MQNSSITTIGVDLGDRKSHVCVLEREASPRGDAAGKVIERRAIATTKLGFERFFTRDRCTVALEVGQHSRWVSAHLEQLGQRAASPRGTT